MEVLLKNGCTVEVYVRQLSELKAKSEDIYQQLLELGAIRPSDNIRSVITDINDFNSEYVNSDVGYNVTLVFQEP